MDTRDCYYHYSNVSCFISEFDERFTTKKNLVNSDWVDNVEYPCWRVGNWCRNHAL